MKDVNDFLALRRIAIVGVSRDEKDFSRHLFREFCERGYDMVPVNLVADEIEGRDCYQCLQAVHPPVEGVLVMTPSYETARVVRDCLETGVRKVWLYRAGGQGATSEEAIALCKEHGVQLVEGQCPFMFLPATGFIHRAHGFLLKLERRYPARAE
jgi:predicted CoA-binding protein